MENTRQLIAGAVGLVTHRVMLPQNDSFDAMVTGFAGGLLGGILLEYYLPGSSTIALAASGVAGVVAFDYFLFEL